MTYNSCHLFSSKVIKIGYFLTELFFKNKKVVAKLYKDVFFNFCCVVLDGILTR